MLGEQPFLGSYIFFSVTVDSRMEAHSFCSSVDFSSLSSSFPLVLLILKIHFFDIFSLSTFFPSPVLLACFTFIFFFFFFFFTFCTPSSLDALNLFVFYFSFYFFLVA